MAKSTAGKPAKDKQVAADTLAEPPAKKAKVAASSAPKEAKAKTAKPKSKPTKAAAADAKPAKKTIVVEEKEAVEVAELPLKKADAKGKRARKEVVVEVEEVAVSKPKAGKKKAESKAHKESGTKTTKPKSKPVPVEESEAGEEAEEDEAEAAPAAVAQDAEEEVEFFGFATDDDDDDSSDEELDLEADGVDVAKLPTIAKDDATVKRKLDKAKKKPTGDRGVLYLGKIPHGFYEAQMKAYFSQFGDVTRLRLSRNKTTGRSKHYAFIEFDSSAVAEIVAETMDNYLLMGHILSCKVIPKDEVHPELWVGANRKWKVIPRGRISRLQHNKARTEEEQAKAESRLLRRQEQKKRKLAQAGINYDFDAVAYKKAKPAKA